MKKIVLLVLACATVSCSTASPTAPSSTDQSAPPMTLGALQPAQTTDAEATAFSRCLSGAQEGACFARPTTQGLSAVHAEAIAQPLSLSATAVGGTVTLAWSAPQSPVSAYLIEAGSAPTLSNLANFSTGNAQTSFSATNVGAGTYYVRVRAMNATGEISAPSNEAVLVVGGASLPCMSPGAPANARLVSNSGGVITLAWNTASGSVTSYMIEAGSASGLSNVANSDVGLTTTLTATGVGSGTYYVRVRAKGPCGTSTASNEVVFTVGSVSPAPTPNPPSSPRSSFGPGTYRVGADIAAGRYYSVPAYGCYWERLSGFGGTFAEILANDFLGPNLAQAIVDVLPTDAGFSTDSDCRTWFNTPRYGFQSTVPAGAWLVGSQVGPGTYRAAAGYGCYWERRRNFAGTLSGIIANNFVSAAGPQIVSISAGDTGFFSDSDCGPWTRVSALTSASTADQTAAQGAEQTSADIERQWQSHRSRTGVASRSMRR